MKKSHIAVYSFKLERWFYWNAKTQQFDLMQKGETLSYTPHTPIHFRPTRTAIS
ncbi:hypothetical protein [Phormidesmis sp. 146-33]